MQLTDTHTHLYYHEGRALDEQIARCKENHITRLFLPNVDGESIDKVFRTCSRYPDICYPMLGLHPCSVKDNFMEELTVIEEALSTNTVVAIGEIGLDLYWDKTTLPQQREAFKIQVTWAKERNLPIVIHCREAFEEQFALLEELKDEKLFGIFHCFTGNLAQAQQAISLGFYLGIGGVVTFKNAGLDKVVEQIDLEHIVLETDAPYLAPVPFRGKPNESSYLIHVAQKVADIHGLTIAEVADRTTQNAQTVFGI
ncbi:TatD family hydrolase [Olivibacter sp. CPCC 100613]|uniref:TatD family hydrolase n=1 Tax=Olivibacter sp. CPCC 100613 TaxID=3079931 RepID=UPI002FFB6598